MTLGIIAVLSIVLGIVAAVGFFVLKRALRWAVRLFLLGAAVVLLLAGALMWWWYSPVESGGPARPSRNGGAARPARPSR